MAPRTTVVWDESFTAYDFGPTHPMGPVRLDLTTRLCRALGVLDHVDLVCPGVADDDTLATGPRPRLHRVRPPRLGRPGIRGPAPRPGHRRRPRLPRDARGVGPDRPGDPRDLPPGGEGEREHGVNYCGGLHHAMRTHASGFCIYNDVAVGIQWLLDHGADGVAYVDIDVHHGDGVERMFWNDHAVLTISIHENGQHLFPGTGWPADIGGPRRRGTAANVALPPGTADAAWLRALDSVVGRSCGRSTPTSS